MFHVTENLRIQHEITHETHQIHVGNVACVVLALLLRMLSCVHRSLADIQQ
jgi:hypothetical protein